MRFRREVVVALVALIVTACAGASAEPNGTADPTAPPVSGTIGGVGALPDALPTVPIAASSSEPSASSSDETTTSLIDAEGNRVLLIGDSILAATSKRYTNDVCKALVPLGWRVAVEAEVSRSIDFAKVVLDRRLDEGWDVGVIFLGTNYDLDPNAYLRKLNDAIARFEGKPVVLLTTSVFDPRQEKVNEIIRQVADLYDNVSVIEWSEVVADDPGLLFDGIHPTPEGREVLAGVIALQLRAAPAEPGACLDSVFDDDSAGSVTGSTTTVPRSGATVPRSSSTVPRSTTTTVPRGSTTTTPGPTSPPTTVPATTPPPTSPPTTAPPATTPPPTPPPSPPMGP
jgi:hypothetical protein